MPKPTGKIPYEIFGHSTGEPVNEEANQHFNEQHCRFIGAECLKPRKSQPETKIGSCIVGYRVKKTDYQPIIICPYRFNEDIVFRSIEEQYFPGQKVKWIKEVKLGDRGSIDYVAAIPNGSGNLNDFLCVEFQAAGTTGTPWPGIEHFRVHHTAEGMPDMKYGINWANEYVKTLMQQINKKGSLIEEWGKKIVVVIQDAGIEYIMSQGKGIGEFDMSKSVHFLSFKLDYTNSGWTLTPSKRYSADMKGIKEVLISEGGKKVTAEAFEEKILKKGEKDKVWDWSRR